MTYRILLFLPAVLILDLGCTPLVGAMLDKPPDASIDIPAEFTCSVDDECPPGYFCSKPGCTPTGTCKPMQRSCDEVEVDPVCACDGIQYDNECLMEKALKSMMYDGPCPTVGCRQDNPVCPDETTKCDGICGEAEGKCVPWEPCSIDTPVVMRVCGCPPGEPGVYQIYEGGDCERIMSGAWKATSLDMCGSITSCYPETQDADCPVGNFCEGYLGDCYGSGWCEPRNSGETCEERFEPVCACGNVTGNVTYLNDCMRKRNGVRKYSDGPCQCGSWSDPSGEVYSQECVDPQFCEYAEGTCPDAAEPLSGDTAAFGECVPKDFCTEEMRTSGNVCGCDLVTYGNDCERRNAGTSLLCRGTCLISEDCLRIDKDSDG